MSTYVALTTINFQQNGYDVVAEGTDKQAVEAQAESTIKDKRLTSIYEQTELRNLIVLSKSEAKRKRYI